MLSHGKLLGIIVGENHKKPSNFLLELGFLNLAHSMGIDHFLVESPLYLYEKACQTALTCDFADPYESMLYKKIKFALYLGMKIIFIDAPNRTESLKITTVCDTMSQVFNEERETAFCQNTLATKAHFIMFLGHYHPSYFPNRCSKIKETHTLSYFHLESPESEKKIKNTLNVFRTCDDYMYNRYKEAIAFREA